MDHPKMPTKMDRFFVETRSELDGKYLVGHAAVFNQVADLRSHLETLATTAFDQALQGSDARFLFNHDPSALLGRQSAGTLQVRTDSEGLAFHCELPDTQLGRDVRTLVERGDLNGCSFGFIPGEDTWTRAANGMQLRTHTSISRLADLSIVSFPAYDGTSVVLRAYDFTTPVIDNRTLLLRARHNRNLPKGGNHK